MRAPMSDTPIDVALFITCLVDLFRPRVGFATVKLLEDAGCRVSVPDAQTCCGQPAYNSGDFDGARVIARQVIDAFDGFRYVVAPSGSCAGMIKVHFPSLFDDDRAMRERATELAGRTFELTSFLVDVRQIDNVAARLDGIATYHDSCAGLRELKVHDQPRQLLASVDHLSLRDLPDADVCCGFGGTFCVKYADISVKMVDEKADSVIATGADTLLAGDLGCLMNMAGRLHRRGAPVRVRHIAEVLADMADAPAIGEPD